MEIKWPKPNMDFYKKATDPWNEIKVENSGVLEDDFFRYANNFYEAALHIMNRLIGSESKNTNIAELDLWYFALIYLYRQSLELMLKANIFALVKNDKDRKDIIGLVRHDVGAAFDKIIELTGIDVNIDKNAKWLQTFLNDISKIDRESDMFRYPFGHNLRILFEKQTHISLEATYFNFGRAFDTLKEFYQTKQIPTIEYKEYEPKLIVEGGSYYTQSVVGYKYYQRAFHPYYTSYEECAKYLAKVIKDEFKDHLFMPMCYLYRNAIELALKRIIIEDSSTIDIEKAFKICKKKKHSILGLYNSIKPELDAHDNGTDTTLVDDVFKYINSFHDIDTTSDKFRYPCDNDLNIHFKDKTELDIDNVSSCFEELINFLDGVSHMLGYEKEIEAEIAAEYASEMASEYSDDSFSF